MDKRMYTSLTYSIHKHFLWILPNEGVDNWTEGVSQSGQLSNAYTSLYCPRIQYMDALKCILSVWNRSKLLPNIETRYCTHAASTNALKRSYIQYEKILIIPHRFALISLQFEMLVGDPLTADSTWSEIIHNCGFCWKLRWWWIEILRPQGTGFCPTSPSLEGEGWGGLG